MVHKNIVFVVMVGVVGIGAFWGGMKYQETKLPVSTLRQFSRGQINFNRSGNQDGQVRNFNAGRPVIGEVLKTDGQSITVQLSDGGSKIIIVPNNVSVSKTQIGSREDLKVGVKVGIFGTENTDGSITAQNVQLNPTFRIMENNR